MRANSFLLCCMASPVLHKIMRCSFREGMTKRLTLKVVNGEAFEKAMNIWCWKEGRAG